MLIGATRTRPAKVALRVRTISQRRNIKLRVVAGELVETISRTKPGTTGEPAAF